MLAGGAARRLGGADKPGVRVGGRALLDRVLSACADARATVVVADPRPTARPVRWAREEPPGGGPLAALDAGLRHTTADHVVVLSADLPFLGPDTVGGLLAALGASDADGVLLTDGEGRDQPLVAAYRAAALHRALAALAGPTPTDASGDSVPPAASVAPDGPVASTASATSGGPPVPGGPAVPGEPTPPTVSDASIPPAALGDRAASAAPGTPTPPATPGGPSASGDPVPPGTPADGAPAPSRASRRGLAGLPLRRLVAALDLVRVVDRRTASFDCDTWDDIATARARIREHGHVLDEWISAVKDELGIDLDVDTGVLLDLARDAAHGVARPAAPLTTFLVGYAAARAEGGPEAVAEAARKAAALALRWADEDTSGQGTPGQGTPGQGTPGQDTPGQDTPGQGTAGEPDVAPDATPDTRPDAG
ncbi:NTP transferase domain-containing protein [Streptomyces seoulensis]|nr:NTP transferase domain-containing protein [Streptomyces seoulensis]